MCQLIDIAFDGAHRSTYGLSDVGDEFADVPLALHASYSREEMLAAFGWVSEKRTPATMLEGVV